MEKVIIIMLVVLLVIFATFMDNHIPHKRVQKCKATDSNIVTVYGRVYTCGDMKK